VGQGLCFAAQGDKTPEAGPTALKISCSRAGDAGDFCDAGQHAAKPFCTVISYERGTERPGIWRPQRWNYYYFRAWISVGALLPKELKHPQQDPLRKTLFKSGWFGHFR